MLHLSFTIMARNVFMTNISFSAINSKYPHLVQLSVHKTSNVSEGKSKILICKGIFLKEAWAYKEVQALSVAT